MRASFIAAINRVKLQSSLKRHVGAQRLYVTGMMDALQPRGASSFLLSL
jgi:hypothetical protein